GGFDLGGVDVLAAADDHVLQPADDLHVALGVHHRQIAGVHPAGLVDAALRRRLVAPVAAHDAVAARAELARRAARQHGPRRPVADADLDVRLHAAGRA